MTRTLIVSRRGQLLVGLLEGQMEPALDAVAAADSAVILQLSRQKPPELVVLDSVEPGFLSVHELTPIWHLWDEAFVVAVVPSRLDEIARSTLALNVQGVLVDPFDLRQVRAVMERAQNHRAQHLGSGTDALSTFLKGLSHHLLNPLASISGLTQILLADEDAESERAKRFRLILKESDRIHTLVNDLDLFLKTRKAERTKLQAASFAERLVEDLNTSVGVPLTVECDASIPDLFGNEEQLAKAMMALMEFAAGKSAGPPQPVTMRVTAKGPKVIFHLEGTTRLTLPDPPGSIFIPFASFQQAERPGSLDLAVAYGIIHNHQGTVHVGGNRDGSVHLQVELPVAPAFTESVR